MAFVRILVVLLLMCAETAQAQYNINWDRAYGGRGDETLVDILPLANGDYLLAGTSTSPVSGNKTAEPKGWMDFYVIRINSQGDIIWDRTYGGDKRDELTSVIQTSDGNFLLAGHSSSGISGDKSEEGRGDADYWIVMIDSDGNIIWDRTYGGNRDDILQKVIENPDGGFVLGGYSISGLSGDKSEPEKRTGSGFHARDLWIIHIDENGGLLWDRTLGHDQQDELGEMIVNSSGNISFVSIYGTTFLKQSDPAKSDFQFTEEEKNSYNNGYWAGELSIQSGILLKQDHLSLGPHRYAPHKILHLEEEDVISFVAIDEDWGSGDNKKERVAYTFETEIEGCCGGSALQRNMVSFDGQLVFDEGRINAFTVRKGNHTDGVIQVFTKNGLPRKFLVGGLDDESGLVIGYGNSSGSLVGMSSYSSVYPDGSKYSQGNGGSDFWILDFKSNLPDGKKWTLSLGDFDEKGSYGEYIPMHITKGVSGGVVTAIYAKGNDGLLKSSSDPGIWLLSVGNDGQSNWEKTIRTDQRRRVTELLTSSNGYFIGSIAPYYIWDYFYSEESIFYLTKTDSEGNVEWEREYPITTFGAVEGMALSLDGNGVIVNSAVKKGSYETLNTVQYIDGNGDRKWGFNYESDFYEYNNYGIEPVQGKGYLISDYVKRSHSFILLDSEGNEIWIADGGRLASGISGKQDFFYALDQFQESGDPIWNLRLRQYDYDGNLVGQQRYPDFTAAGVTYDFIRPDGGIVIFEPIGGQYIELDANLDQLIYSSVYIDQDRSISNDIIDYVDASPMDEFNYVRVIYDWDNSNYYLSAIPYTFSQIQTSINNESLDTALEEHFLYPNPVDTYFWIAGNGIRSEHIEIRDLNGRLCHLYMQKEFGKLRVDTSQLSPGMYLITIQAGDTNELHRFIKR